MTGAVEQQVKKLCISFNSTSFCVGNFSALGRNERCLWETACTGAMVRGFTVHGKETVR
jgi:hypothetical protein